MKFYACGKAHEREIKIFQSIRRRNIFWLICFIVGKKNLFRCFELIKVHEKREMCVGLFLCWEMGKIFRGFLVKICLLFGVVLSFFKTWRGEEEINKTLSSKNYTLTRHWERKNYFQETKICRLFTRKTSKSFSMFLKFIWHWIRTRIKTSKKFIKYFNQKNLESYTIWTANSHSSCILNRLTETSTSFWICGGVLKQRKKNFYCTFSFWCESISRGIIIYVVNVFHASRVFYAWNMSWIKADCVNLKTLFFMFVHVVFNHFSFNSFIKWI